MPCRPINYPFVHRWRTPPQKILAGERTPGGRPPFDPFLDATMLWQAHLCPIAALHDLLHGEEVKLGRGFHRGRPRLLLSGQDWHQYIANLRLKIASRRLVLPDDIGHALEVIRHDFEEWAREKQIPNVDQEEIWRSQVESYATTRLNTGQLTNIVGHALLPEVTVGSARVEVPLGGGMRTYPIEARIDELDLTTGVVIERTSLPLARAVSHKDVQLAVIAVILRSIPATGIPQQWGAVRQVRQFVLETHTDSVMVNPGSEHYDAIHEAAAIIRDVAASELAEWPIYQRAQCTLVQPHDVCSHPSINCFHPSPAYPQSRAPLKRETRLLCRAELYELLWQRDLTKYRLYNAAHSGSAYPGLPLEILGTGQNPSRGPFVEAKLVGGGLADLERGILIVGTPFIGVRREVSIEENPDSGTIRLYCNLMGLPLPRTGVLWPVVREGLLFEQTPDFLIRQRQQYLFTLRKIGTNDLRVSQQDAVLQLLEALFGGAPPLET